MLFINGIDIRDIDPDNLFTKISVVPQETFLFSRSIAENISLGVDGNVDLEKVKGAARNAGLDGDIMYALHLICNTRYFKVTLACSCEEAIENAIEKRMLSRAFDIMVSDCDTPDMNGAEMIHALSKSGIQIPILLTAGVKDQRQVDKLLSEDCQTHSCKMVNVITFLKEVDRMITKNAQDIDAEKLNCHESRNKS